MIKKGVTLLLSVFVLTVAWGENHYAPGKKNSLRAPSVPLVTSDPYFCIWSPYDKLYEGNTEHWTGKEQALIGALRVDGKTYRFMGREKQAFETILPMADLEKWEADYTESMNTFRSASEEYEQECADIRRRVESGELIRYAVIGDRGIEFYYDEPIPVTEEQDESNSARQTRPDDSPGFSGNTFTTVSDIVSFAGESVDPETGEILSSQGEEMSAKTIDRAKTQEEIEREEKINVLKERHDNNYQLYLDHMAADMKIALRKTDYREGALTEEEQRIFWFLLLRTLDRRLYPQFGLNEHDWPISEERQVRICRELTTEQQVLLLREFIRDKLMEHCSVPGLIRRFRRYSSAGRLPGDPFTA